MTTPDLDRLVAEAFPSCLEGVTLDYSSVVRAATILAASVAAETKLRARVCEECRGLGAVNFRQDIDDLVTEVCDKCPPCQGRGIIFGDPTC